jgi:biopolymer transport protein ExbD
MRPFVVLVGLLTAAQVTWAEEDHSCLPKLEVVVSDDNTCHINQSTYSCDSLGFIVKSMGAGPRCGLHIRVERDAPVEIAAAAIASLHKAGFAKVQVDLGEHK